MFVLDLGGQIEKQANKKTSNNKICNFLWVTLAFDLK